MMSGSKIVRVKQIDEEIFWLTFIINNICPNACSYCPSNLHNGTNHNYDWNRAKQFFIKLFEKHPKVHCAISGGEPSVSPFFPELVKMFRQNNSTIGITSNAAKPVAYWEEIAPDLQYICFSWHPEFVDKKFDEKAAAAAKYTFVMVRIMMHPDYWDQCVEKYNSYKLQTDCSFEPVRVYNWDGVTRTFDYTKEQLDWFENNKPRFVERDSKTANPELNLGSTYYFDDGSTVSSESTGHLINAGITKFKGFNCKIGLNSLMIDAFGEVRRGNCLVGGAIGNINDVDNINWPTKSIICDVEKCTCGTDVEITKWI
jgi:organic radical activating enzyme